MNRSSLSRRRLFALFAAAPFMPLLRTPSPDPNWAIDDKALRAIHEGEPILASNELGPVGVAGPMCPGAVGLPVCYGERGLSGPTYAVPA